MTHKNTFFAWFVIIVGFALCVLCANLFSSAITAGSFTSMFKQKNTSFDVYALYSGVYDSKDEAEKNTAVCVENNGGANVFLFLNKYYIIHSAFEEKNDAIKTCEAYSNKIELSILNIQVSDIKVDDILEDGVSAFHTAFVSICDLAVALDTKAITKAEAVAGFVDLTSTIYTIQKNLDKEKDKLTSDTAFNVRLKLSSLVTYLQDNKKELELSQNPSSLLKYIYMQSLAYRLEIV